MAVHEHCRKCFSLDCTKDSSFIGFGDDSCPMVECDSECGAKLHECKLKDHIDKICPNAIINCLNYGYGCPHTMARKKIIEHLSTCPASVVICQHDWPREDTIPLSQDDIGDFEAVEPSVEPPFLVHSSSSSGSVFSPKICGQKFRRDEYYYHYKNVHGDVQSGKCRSSRPNTESKLNSEGIIMLCNSNPRSVSFLMFLVALTAKSLSYSTFSKEDELLLQCLYYLKYTY